MSAHRQANQTSNLSLIRFLYTSPTQRKATVMKNILAHLQFLLFSTFSLSVFHSRCPRPRRTPWLFKRKWRTCISSSSRCFDFVYENAIPPPCDDCEKHRHGSSRAGLFIFLPSRKHDRPSLIQSTPHRKRRLLLILNILVLCVYAHYTSSHHLICIPNQYLIPTGLHVVL